MVRVVYVNGRYLPYAQAGVHVEDRGFQFADSVYEVCEINAGRLVDESRHLARLARSLSELAIEPPMSDNALRHVMRETVLRNRVRDGLLYLQVTRGAAPRDFNVPAGGLSPTLVCLARPLNRAKIASKAAAGVAVITRPDIRWRRCDLKTVMLLPAVLAKEAAREAGAQEAWFVDDGGFVTEGASSNAWIITSEGRVVTRPLNTGILAGVTRATLRDLIAREGLTFEERAFQLSEVLSAREAFITSASGTVMPVVRIDGQLVGTGRPGDLTLRLRTSFHQVAEFSRVIL